MPTLPYTTLMQQLKERKFDPVYYLMGEEPYYIDCVANYVEQNILTPEEASFNLTTIYATPDTRMADIINMARRFPMMSEYQVVMVREAQNLSHIDELSFYLQKPQPRTLLLFCHKYGKLDKRKKITAEIEKHGVIFISDKLRDTQIPAFATGYAKELGLDLEPKAADMIIENVGADLCRIASELKKVSIAMPASQRTITAQMVEQHIGISKEYNNFELRDALIRKDVAKAYRIVNNFAKNPKANPIQMTLALLFSFFANLMQAYYAPDKTDRGIALWLGYKNAWSAKDYVAAMRMYSGKKVMQILHEIRLCDARSKGIGCTSAIDQGALLQELVYFILH